MERRTLSAPWWPLSAVAVIGLMAGAAAGQAVGEGVGEVGAGGGGGQPAAGVEPEDRAALEAELVRLVGALGSPLYRDREAAAETLARDDRFTLAVLERELLREREAGAALTPEQRLRLIGAAQARFAAAPRGAMGVQWGFFPGDADQSEPDLPERVIISRTFEKFDSHTKLQPGDMIVEADGRPIAGTSGRMILQSMIISREPGDVLGLKVRRGAEKLDLLLTIGRFSDLENGNLDELRLLRAWRWRSREYAGDGAGVPGAVLRPAVEPREWAEWGAGELTPQGRQRAMLRARLPGERPTAGGGVPPAERAEPLEPRDMIIQQAMAGRQGVFIGQQVFVRGGVVVAGVPAGAVAGGVGRRGGGAQLARMLVAGQQMQDLMELEEQGLPRMSVEEELRVLTESAAQLSLRLREFAPARTQSQVEISMRAVLRQRLELIERVRAAIEAEAADAAKNAAVVE